MTRKPPVPPARGGLRVRWTPAATWTVGIVLVIGLAAGILVVRRSVLLQGAAQETRPGRLAIDTRPSNLEILIDGEPRGLTPLTLAVAPGAHNVTIRNGSSERVVPVTITAGGEVTQYFEMQPADVAPLTGRLSIDTEPPGARVFIDGVLRGTSPLTVNNLRPAEHRVSVATDGAPVERTVSVAAGGTASVLFSLHKSSGPVGGWFVVDAPFDVEIVERDELIGAPGARRIMVAAGRHDVVLINRSLGYRDARTVDVVAGKTTTIRVDPPKVAVSLNARPWADVTLDGTSIGQTPIANLLIAVGSHEVVFRHPQLGEQRQSVVVMASGPNRFVADMTK